MSEVAEEDNELIDWREINRNQRGSTHDEDGNPLPMMPHLAEVIDYHAIVKELVNAHDALRSAIVDDSAPQGAQATPDAVGAAVTLNAAGRRMNEAWDVARAALEAAGGD